MRLILPVTLTCLLASPVVGQEKVMPDKPLSPEEQLDMDKCGAFLEANVAHLRLIKGLYDLIDASRSATGDDAPFRLDPRSEATLAALVDESYADAHAVGNWSEFVCGS